MQEAARDYLADRKRKDDIERYIRGYQEFPETEEETAFVDGARNDPLPPYNPR